MLRTNSSALQITSFYTDENTSQFSLPCYDIIYIYIYSAKYKTALLKTNMSLSETMKSFVIFNLLLEFLLTQY